MPGEIEALAPSAQPTSRRELAKEERRGRIVAAAHDLLREVGIDELSMKQVAARAGLSLSTVYNLFGSKQAVLAVVFDLDLQTYAALVASAPSADALERILDCIDLAADLYEADPGFYRAMMWRSAGGAGDPFLNAALREPRHRFWRKMIADAAAEGRLSPFVDPAVLGALIVQIFNGVLVDWIAGVISLDAFRAEAKFGFCVALSAFAAEADARRLRDRVEALQDVLSASRSEASSPERVQAAG